MKLKRFTAMALALTLSMSTFAFADTKSAQGEKPIYTFDQVFEKVKKSSSSLSLLESNLDLINKQSTYTGLLLGAIDFEGASQSAVMDSNGTITKLNQLNVATKTSTYQQESLLLSLEYSVMGMLAGINAAEEEIKISTLKCQTYQQKYNMTVLKKKLGMVSEVDVINAKQEMDNYKIQLEALKVDLANSYSALARAMGVTDTNFGVDFSIEYKPFELKEDISTFVMRKLNGSPSIQGARYALKNAENTKEFAILNNVSVPYGKDAVEVSIEETAASLKSSEDAIKASIESTYKGLIDLEEKIKTNEANLLVAKKNLVVVEENLAAGRAVQLNVDEAKLNVAALENGIQSLKDTYMLTVFSMEHPGAAGGGASQGGASQGGAK